MKKTVVLSSITLAAIASLFALVRFMKLDSFAFAWALNFLLMLFVSFYLDAAKSTLMFAYLDEKKWEQRGKIYELLGVNFFRKLLVLIGWEKLIRKSNPIEKTTDSLMNLYYQTKKAEQAHLVIFFIVLGFNIVVATQFGVIKSLWLLVLNVLLNLYPVFLQRYNRPRIARALKLSRRG